MTGNATSCALEKKSNAVLMPAKDVRLAATPKQIV